MSETRCWTSIVVVLRERVVTFRNVAPSPPCLPDLQRNPAPNVAQARMVDPQDLVLGLEVDEARHEASHLGLQAQRAADMGVGLVHGLIALLEDLADDGGDVRRVSDAPELLGRLHDLLLKGRDQRNGHLLKEFEIPLLADPALVLRLCRQLPRALDLQAVGVDGGGGPSLESGLLASCLGQDLAVETLILAALSIIVLNLRLSVRGLIAGDALFYSAAIDDILDGIETGFQWPLTVVTVVLARGSSGFGELRKLGEIRGGEDAPAAFIVPARASFHLLFDLLRGRRMRHRSGRVGPFGEIRVARSYGADAPGHPLSVDAVGLIDHYGR
ncbi:hypothetical protein PG994_013294 [Apiospora phragmitis]|uniref:Uncharacterized protein n=1 Tax=Apiospora phragmitis TaxID=2905665 RepID=A0ABR1T886_9PEZI